MSGDEFDDCWLDDGELLDDEYELLDGDEITDAMGNFVITAQQCTSGSDGLRKALGTIFDRSQIFKFGAKIKTLNTEEQARIVSKMAQCYQVTARNATHTARTFIQKLTSDPGSPGHQSAMQFITSYLSNSDTDFEDVSQAIPSGSREKRHPTKRLQLEEYSESVTRALHDSFHKCDYLPCTCSINRATVCLSERYNCAVRLDGYQHVPGDDHHYFFDSIIASKDDDKHHWTTVQFRLPRLANAHEAPMNCSSLYIDDRNSKLKSRVSLSANIIDTQSDPSPWKVSGKQLDDFCGILGWNIRGFRVHVIKNPVLDLFTSSVDKFVSGIFPEQGPPMLLSVALRQDELSARQKIFLSFTIAKAFWQYYDSEWTKVVWSLETLQLLPTQSHESDAPFLNISSSEFEDPICRLDGSELFSATAPPRLHPDNYILNLGLLLVQLGSISADKDAIAGNATGLTGIQKNNDICMSCCAEINADSSWPRINLPINDRRRYRDIVEQCLPTRPSRHNFSKPLFEEGCDTANRRLALKDFVVRPLFELWQDMANLGDTTPQKQQPSPSQYREPPVLRPGIGYNKSAQTQCDLASDWLHRLTNSWLHSCVSGNVQNSIRPKIAIIDTGFDAQARCVDRKLKMRLNMIRVTEAQYNWKDYWQSETAPKDTDGHGTAMLSIIHKIAPFANICVARVAGNSEDLKNDATATSSYLAKSILWAVEEQGADIISLSLGWEQEHLVDGERVISNAISRACSRRNQNVLIFAAASNLGGSKHELFPATHHTVFSIRGTNTTGRHEDFNPSLPKGDEKVFGTLGVKVPTSARRELAQQYIERTGTSVATAIAAGIAAIVIGYINVHDGNTLIEQTSCSQSPLAPSAPPKQWDKIRTFEGYRDLLNDISSEPEVRKRFINLENFSREKDRGNFETALSRAS